MNIHHHTPRRLAALLLVPQKTLKFLNLKAGDRLMSIRSSDIAFTMGAKGPLIEKGMNYPGQIEVF